MHLSVVTVCMNRQMHLTETAPRVQAWADALGLAWEHVVVDWNSTVPLIRESLPASGSLRLIRVQGEQEWCAARAYNFACAQAKGELLMRLDADCWPERLTAEQLEQLSAGDVLEGALAGGSEGSWLMHRQLFEDVGGFHELLRGYGCEDIDLRARLKLRGARINTLSPEAIRVIRHESDLRVGLVLGNMSRSAAAIARAWKDALVEANRWAVVQHPWSVHRPHTAYRQCSGGPWTSIAATVPQPPAALDQQLQRIRRQRFWSRFLLLSPSVLDQLPQSWFGGFDGRGFGVRRWHRFYWHTGRRLVLLLHQLLIHFCRRVGG